MPSMDNAQAVLFVAVSYCLNRRLGNIMLAYAIIIFVGSPGVLGWLRECHHEFGTRPVAER